MPSLQHPHPVTLEARPLIVRPWYDNDAAASHEAIQESVQSVGRWLVWRHAGYDLDEARRWITSCPQGWEASDYYSFAVFDAQARWLGDVRLTQLDESNLRGNLRFWLRASAKGSGHAVRAACAVAAFGFEALVLRRIEIVSVLSKHASQRCAERISVQREGVAPHRVLLHGQWESAAIYGLLANDLA